MPWHLSKSDPRKVYDPAHCEYCTCVQPESAAIICDLLNRLRRKEPIASKSDHQGSAGGDHAHEKPPASIRLKEPETLAPTEAHEADPCCGKLISKALRDGVLRSLQSWDCPSCGCEWKPETRFADGAPFRYWRPHPAMEILRL